LNLIITNSSSSSEDTTVCDSYAWNGNTYTESGSYTYTTLNAEGCDSTITLALTINNTDLITDIHYACDSFIWIDGNTYYESNDTSFVVYQNSMGCDSIISLDLTLSYSDSSTIVINSCEPYLWNDSLYSVSGTYSFDTISSSGCDSTAFLDLYIPEFDPISIIGPNNVVGGSSSNYTLNQNGLNYNWEISANGQILNGQGSNNTVISWDDVNASSEICVYAYDELDCKSDTTCLTVDISRITFIEEETFGIHIFPNPFRHKTTIDLTNCEYIVLELELYDLQGKKIYSTDINNEHQIELINNNLNNKMYILRLIGPNINSYIKLLTH
jgi:hypothetical protein